MRCAARVNCETLVSAGIVGVLAGRLLVAARGTLGPVPRDLTFAAVLYALLALGSWLAIQDDWLLDQVMLMTVVAAVASACGSFVQALLAAGATLVRVEGAVRAIPLVTLTVVGILLTGCGTESRSAASVTGAPGSESSAAPTQSAGAAGETAAPDEASIQGGKLSCAEKGPCRIGDIGPGGGEVFLDAGPGQDWDRYLEVAPPGWSGQAEDPKAPWCDEATQWAIPKASTSEGFGQGLANTERLFEIQPCAAATAMYMARAYRGAGLNDWYLPSKGELVALNIGWDSLPGFDSWYWSSSRRGSTMAWTLEFKDFGREKPSEFSSLLRVRPIPAF